MDLLTQLLPRSEHLQLQSYELDPEQRHIRLVIESIQETVCCPVCGQAAHRLHSSYERTLADLPWGDYRITLQLTVGKFFCDQETCERQIFTERIAGVMAPWARRTQRLAAQLVEVGLRAGGEGGAKLSQRLHCPVSQNTVLSLIRRQSLPAMSVPQTLGVDDFALRRGQRYGTILVDLEAHQPIALLPDREAATLAQWLQDHPGVEVLSRDRSQSYKQGMTQGAPAAIQVADRFHLLKNLAESLEQIFHEAMPSRSPIESPQSPTLEPTPILPPEIEPADLAHAQRVRAQRFARYQQVWEMHRAGWQQRMIAQQLGIGERTVSRYLKSETFPERRERKDRGLSLLDPYQTQILDRWNQGCREARQLHQRLQEAGCQASYGTVARYVRRLRQAQGLQKRQRRTSLPLPPLQNTPRLTARKATWIVLRRPEHRKPEELEQLEQVLTHSSTLTRAVDLSQQFIEMVRYRSAERLDPWYCATSFTTFHFEHCPNLNPAPLLQLAQDVCWLERAENLILLGPSGVGKPQPRQYPDWS